MKLPSRLVDAPDCQLNWERMSTQVMAPVVDEFPSHPFDGQEVDYLANGTDDIVWHFKYRAASTSLYKWVCTGGQPIRAVASASQTILSAGLTTYVAPGTPVSLNAPLAGDYVAMLSADLLNNSSGNNVNARVGVSVAAAAPTILARQELYPTVLGAGVTVSRRGRLLAVAAAAAVSLRVSTNALNASMVDASLELVPLRVA